MNLLLRITAICPRDHWMLHEPPDTIIAEKTIDVENIDSVRFEHSERHSGFLTDTVEQYSAVRYEDKIFRLQYDLSCKCWIGELRVNYPNQGLYFMDWSEKFREEVKGYYNWQLIET